MDTKQAESRKRDAHAVEDADTDMYKRGMRDSNTPQQDREDVAEGEQYGQDNLIQEHKF
jgi:hypothetical protein